MPLSICTYSTSLHSVLISSRGPVSELPSQSGVQVLLVDLVDLAVPAVVCQQGHVPGGDGAHLHGARRPLHSAEVVQPVVQDEGRRPPMRWAVRRISHPGLGHRIPWEEHALQVLLRQRLQRGHPPDFGVAGGGAFVASRDVHGVERGQAVDERALGVSGEHVRHSEVRGRLRAAEVGHVKLAVDQSGHRLVVEPGVVRRDWRREAWEGDVRLPLVKRRCYYHDVIQRVSGAGLPNVTDLIVTGCGAWKYTRGKTHTLQIHQQENIWSVWENEVVTWLGRSSFDWDGRHSGRDENTLTVVQQTWANFLVASIHGPLTWICSC